MRLCTCCSQGQLRLTRSTALRKGAGLALNPKPKLLQEAVDLSRLLRRPVALVNIPVPIGLFEKQERENIVSIDERVALQTKAQIVHLQSVTGLAKREHIIIAIGEPANKSHSALLLRDVVEQMMILRNRGYPLKSRHTVVETDQPIKVGRVSFRYAIPDDVVENGRIGHVSLVRQAAFGERLFEKTSYVLLVNISIRQIAAAPYNACPREVQAQRLRALQASSQQQQQGKRYSVKWIHHGYRTPLHTQVGERLPNLGTEVGEAIQDGVGENAPEEQHNPRHIRSLHRAKVAQPIVAPKPIGKPKAQQ